MRILLDTNIILRIAELSSPYHDVAEKHTFHKVFRNPWVVLVTVCLQTEQT